MSGPTSATMAIGAREYNRSMTMNADDYTLGNRCMTCTGALEDDSA